MCPDRGSERAGEHAEAGCVTVILITASVTGSENRHGKNSVYVGALILTISQISSVSLPQARRANVNSHAGPK